VQALVKTIGFGDGTAMNPFKKSEENPLLEGTLLKKRENKSNTQQGFVWGWNVPHLWVEIPSPKQRQRYRRCGDPDYSRGCE